MSLWVATLVIVQQTQRWPCGNRCQQCIGNAPCLTPHYWEADQTVLPSQRHRAVGQETGLTSYLERFNNTLRQRVSRFVRKTVSFSKKLANHIAAIWHFIHHDDEQIRLQLANS